MEITSELEGYAFKVLRLIVGLKGYGTYSNPEDYFNSQAERLCFETMQDYAKYQDT